MPKIDVSRAAERKGSGYPPPFDKPCAERVRKRLGDAGGLTQFGVNLLTLAPGVWSSQRHWHTEEDEFVYVVSGEVVLIDNDSEHILRAGDCAAFPKNDGNGHQLVNKSNAVAVCLEVGTRSAEDACDYPDIDMKIESRGEGFVHRDGRPYSQSG
jgi:uncharacterized cupin superfamily protein